MEFWISTGRHRKDKSWKNVKYTWPQLLERLARCQRTNETVNEYLKMDPDDQAIIKDVGGFVGGTINGGRRKKGAVTTRSLVTLDLDTAPADFWEAMTLDFWACCALYSTHKHTPQDPRLRLVIPLDREVLPDEYEAISRRIAGLMGMDYFDPTTFQPERLMYWPSAPKDGVYLFEQQPGDLLDADLVLGTYADWKDVSQWPVHGGEARQIREGVKTAQDPTGKTGIVGAFCRVFGITAAIDEFLSDVYELAGDGRYTYTGGSTSGGLVIYDDKFAYSHHGTDPAGGMLCNSFDLVRLHKYGRMDDRIKEDTLINKRPSFMAMADMARKLAEVNLDIVKQTTGKAQAAFSEDPDADQWLKTLETDKRNKILGTSDNLLIILRNDPNLAGIFALNLFTVREMVLGATPWDERAEERQWGDLDDAGLRWYIETTYGITTVSKINDGVMLIMQENSFHPVRQYLEGLVWDGVERIDTLLIDYLGAADNEYTRTVTRKMMLGAVARIFQPGIKFDNVPVLIGEQGSGKSHFIEVLGGAWYSESFGRLDTKEAMENIQGVWIMEIAELAGLKKADNEVIKHFLSKNKDEFRPAYAKRLAVFLRQNIFIGSSNTWDFINDPTGGRRFWPVPIVKSLHFKQMIFDQLYKVRKQLWAEAVAAWANSEDLHLDARIEAMAEQMQTQHSEVDPWRAVIEKYLEIPLPEKWGDMALYDRKSYLRGDETQPGAAEPRKVVTAFEIWMECLDGDRKSFTSGLARRIHYIMKKVGGWAISDGKARVQGHGAGVSTSSRYFYRLDTDDDL